MSRESAVSGAAGPARAAVIRKYANRRLYNTANGRFVTLADLQEMIRRGEDFVVREAKTERDITAWVLVQIVAEETGKGNHLLPLGYLRRLLHFYHEGLGDHLSTHLESSMELFAANQRDLIRQLSNPFDPVGALSTFRELGERNAEHLTRLFQPVGGGSPDPATPSSSSAPAQAPSPSQPRSRPPSHSGGRDPEPPGAEERSAEPAAGAAPEDDLRALRAQLLAIQRRLDAIERH